MILRKEKRRQEKSPSISQLFQAYNPIYTPRPCFGLPESSLDDVFADPVFILKLRWELIIQFYYSVI